MTKNNQSHINPPPPRQFQLSKIILTTLLAFSLIFTLFLAACSNGSTGGGGGGKPVPKTDTYTGKTADGVEYTLKITQKTARFAILEGDIYELTVGGKTSKGTVSGNTNGKLTLKPDNAATVTFTVTVDDSGIKEISGIITFTDNTKDESAKDAPKTVTPTGVTSGGTNAGGSSNIKFPVIYSNGEFLNGVTVKTGDYETYSGKNNGLTKGKVTLTSSGIVIKPAEGQNNEWNDDNVSGHYNLEFVLANVLDLTGYDGIRIELESNQDGFLSVTLNDAAGTSVPSWGGTVDNLQFATTEPTDNYNVKRGYFEYNWGGDNDGDWALDFSDFTYKIKGMSFEQGVDISIPYSSCGEIKIKSIEFTKNKSGNFFYDDDGSTVTITGYKGTGGNVTIPSAINGKPVTVIDPIKVVLWGNFAKCGFTGITIPSSVTTIGFDAFWNCTSLTSVTIGNGVTSIRSSAFNGCTGLTSVTIPNSVTSIEELAFVDCDNLTTVTFQGNISAFAPDIWWDDGTTTSLEGPFPGDLRDKYFAGGIGTYTRAAGGSTWTKQQ